MNKIPWNPALWDDARSPAQPRAERKARIPVVKIDIPYPDPGEEPITSHDILRMTAQRYGLTLADLQGPSRVKRIAWARQEAMYQVARLTNLSYSQIGRIFKRDPKTVIYGVRTHAKRNGLPILRM